MWFKRNMHETPGFQCFPHHFWPHSGSWFMKLKAVGIPLSFIFLSVNWAPCFGSRLRSLQDRLPVQEPPVATSNESPWCLLPFDWSDASSLQRYIRGGWYLPTLRHASGVGAERKDSCHPGMQPTNLKYPCGKTNVAMEMPHFSWEIPKWEWKFHCDVSLRRVVPNFFPWTLNFFGNGLQQRLSMVKTLVETRPVLLAHCTRIYWKKTWFKNNLSIQSFEKTGPTFVFCGSNWTLNIGSAARSKMINFTFPLSPKVSGTNTCRYWTMYKAILGVGFPLYKPYIQLI